MAESGLLTSTWAISAVELLFIRAWGERHEPLKPVDDSTRALRLVDWLLAKALSPCGPRS